MESFSEALALSGTDSWIETEILSRINSLFRNRDNLGGLRELLQSWVDQYPQRISLHRALAHTLADLQKIDEAEKVYRETVRLSPGNRDARERYAAFLEEIGKTAEAIELYEQLIEANPDDPSLYLRLAGLAYTRRDPEKIKRSISDYIRRSGESDSAFVTGARLLENFGQFAGAEETHRERIKRSPDNLEARENLAAYLFRRNRKKEALSIWNSVAARIEGIEALRIVRTLRTHGQNEAAWKLLLARREAWKNEPAFLNEFCRLSLAVDRPEIAIPEARRLVFLADRAASLNSALDVVRPIFNRSGTVRAQLESLEGAPRKSVPHIALIALLLDLMDRPGEALQKLAALPREDQPLAIEVRVRILESRQLWQPAIAVVKEALELPEGRRADNMIRLVDYSERANQPDEALRWIEEWKKIAPGSVSPWLRQAKVVAAHKSSAEAIPILEKASRRFRGEALIQEQLANLYIDRGLAPEAETIYRKLYETAENAEDKLRWAALFGDVASRLGRQGEAIRLFEDRHRRSPRSEVPILALVERYERSESLGLARTWLRKLLRIRPEHVNALLRLAAIEEKLGNEAEVLSTLERARKFDSTSRSTHRLARFLIKGGKETAGLRLLFESAALDVSDPGELVKVVASLAENRNWKQVRELTDSVLEKHPADPRLNYLKGIALEEEGLSTKAIEQFVHLIKAVSPKDKRNPGALAKHSLRGKLPPGFPPSRISARFREGPILSMDQVRSPETNSIYPNPTTRRNCSPSLTCRSFSPKSRTSCGTIIGSNSPGSALGSTGGCAMGNSTILVLSLMPFPNRCARIPRRWSISYWSGNRPISPPSNRRSNCWRKSIPTVLFSRFAWPVNSTPGKPASLSAPPWKDCCPG